ncbi:hypothetical protein DZD52_09525 [Xanthomonas nasturtii]|uniref:Uncharacterized protein n=1 Tax=Xanthomonas nasturtii TaxID=1843581 RepID=A0A3E1KLL9_9XANT|nr:hypothetical protein DZD52_09525 [Xanthomonas nasturtii]
MRAIGARALERPRRKRGPGRAAGVGVRVRPSEAFGASPLAARGDAFVIAGTGNALRRTLIRRYAPPSPDASREASLNYSGLAPLPSGDGLE